MLQLFVQEQLGAVNFSQSSARMFQVIGSRFRISLYSPTHAHPAHPSLFLMTKEQKQAVSFIPLNYVDEAAILY